MSYTVTVTYSSNNVPVSVECATKAQAEDVTNAMQAIMFNTGRVTGGKAARWYDLTLYFGSVDDYATIKTVKTDCPVAHQSLYYAEHVAEHAATD